MFINLHISLRIIQTLYNTVYHTLPVSFFPEPYHNFPLSHQNSMFIPFHNLSRSQQRTLEHVPPFKQQKESLFPTFHTIIYHFPVLWLVDWCHILQLLWWHLLWCSLYHRHRMHRDNFQVWSGIQTSFPRSHTIIHHVSWSFYWLIGICWGSNGLTTFSHMVIKCYFGKKPGICYRFGLDFKPPSSGSYITIHHFLCHLQRLIDDWQLLCLVFPFPPLFPPQWWNLSLLNPWLFM